jgi:hexosaminidase
MIITNDDGDASFFTLGETAVITVHVLATSANHCVYVNHDVQAATVQKIGHYLADKLKPATGFEFPVVVASATNLPVHELEASVDQKNAINLILIIDDDDDGDEDTESSSSSCCGKEGYKLVVTSNAVCLWAAQPAGLFRGVQTLRQLLPSQVESTTVV